MFILEGTTTKYLTSPEKGKVSEFINTKVFSVADTPLTYRQINLMDTDNLLSKDRDNDKGWRKFSLKELIYIYIVSELKKFGFKHEQLSQLWMAFFKEHIASEDKKTGEIQINKGTGEMVLGCVFGGIEITLCVDSSGQIVFYDPFNYSILYQNSKSQIHINVNNITNSLLAKYGYTQIPINDSLQEAAFNWNKVDMTHKEEKLLEVIRNKDYTTIEVKKKNGEVYLLHAGKVHDGENNVTMNDILKMVKEKDFQDISISKRNGKIANYKIEETIKL